jgi:hypothetical protein
MQVLRIIKQPIQHLPQKSGLDHSDIGQLLRVSASEDTGASLKVTPAFKLIKIKSTVPTAHKFKSALGPKRALTCETAEHVS